MVSANDLITQIKTFSLKERLLIVEEILKGIRLEEVSTQSSSSTGPKILEMAGVLNEADAEVYHNAIDETRKIDESEW